MNQNIGFFKKQLLIFLTRLQEVFIKNGERGFYYFFTKLHFRLYFGKSLVEEAANGSVEFFQAKKRHGNMVVSLRHKESKKKKYLHKLTCEAFTKDLLLQAKV